ncbi:MAG: DUF1156 domain-containing protein, partial [Anaerolineae bacterium]|nr:DUF1156 domain-containing protein [Anaerolineae bacterium]
MTYRKKLIEVALPLEAINNACAREKSIRHGHPSTLHLWWARRPLAAARAVIFTSLVDDPDNPEAPPAFVNACKKLPGDGKNTAEKDTPRQRLFDFIERLVTWEATTDEAILKTARELIRLSTNGNPPPLLDPFAGGGSIPLEAQRLGLEAHASDLNPVAVMINKAMIEIPPKFADMPPINPKTQEGTAAGSSWKGTAGLADDVHYYGEWIRKKAFEKVGHLYPKCNGETIIAWIWARSVKCPNPACGIQLPLTRSFDLSKKKGKRVWIEPYKDSQERKILYKIVHSSSGTGPRGSVSRSGAICLACETPVSLNYIRDEGQMGKMKAQLMAIATDGANGRSYYAPTLEQETISSVPIPEDAPEAELPMKALGFRVQLYGMTKYQNLFTNRQVTTLVTFSDLIADVQKKVLEDVGSTTLLPKDETPLNEGGEGVTAYSEAICVYLSFALDRLAQQFSTLATWSSHPAHELVVNMFSRQTLSMTWDFGEVNPFSEAASWEKSLGYLCRSIKYLSSPKTSVAHVRMADAAKPQMNDGKRFIVSTDPPYYDNIGYADLSDYFYIWLRRSLKKSFPSIFSTMLVPKTQELVANPFKFEGGRKEAKKFFEDGLRNVFSSI